MQEKQAKIATLDKCKALNRKRIFYWFQTTRISLLLTNSPNIRLFLSALRRLKNIDTTITITNFTQLTFTYLHPGIKVKSSACCFN